MWAWQNPPRCQSSPSRTSRNPCGNVRCLAVFALRLVRVEAHPKWGDVRVYRCQKCDAQTEYLTNLPHYLV
jgi:hypothetical protein